MDSTRTMDKNLRALGAEVIFSGSSWVNIILPNAETLSAARSALVQAGHYVQSITNNEDGTLYVRANY